MGLIKFKLMAPLSEVPAHFPRPATPLMVAAAAGDLTALQVRPRNRHRDSQHPGLQLGFQGHGGLLTVSTPARVGTNLTHGITSACVVKRLCERR
jgi:hypothetical protein